MPSRLRKASLPYLLLLPGLGWLLLFFAIPLVYMALESLKSGSPFAGGFHLTWEFSNYTDALKDYASSSSARSSTPGSRPSSLS